MGFRFLFYFNPISRSYLLKIPSKTHLNSIISPQNNRSTIQSIANSHLDGIYWAPLCQNFKRWHFGHSHHDRDHHHGSDLGSGKDSENIFRLGLAADIGLTAGKAITGYLSGSTAIIADAAHSLSDVVLSGVALLSFKASRVPRDKEHPYGHGKFETLGALGISGVLIITAGGIAWHAADILLGIFTAAPELVCSPVIHEHGHPNGHTHKIDMDHPFLALNMTILSIAIKEGLFWMTKRAAEREGSGLMKANAWHHRADAVSSLVALIGVGGSILGVKFLDPLAGLVVSGMILKAGLESGYQSIMELVDAAVPQQQLDPHRQTILQVEGVQGCHRLRGRRAGSFLHLDVHIEVDPFTSVSAAHHIGENVRHQIHKSHPEVVEVFIHIDPSISQFSPGIADLEENSEGTDKINHSICSEHGIYLDHKDVDNIVSTIFLSNFQEKMVVEHITRHLLRNKIMLEVEVSMPPDIMIRDAMLMAEEAKKEILRAASDVIQVIIQLRLSASNHASST